MSFLRTASALIALSVSVAFAEGPAPSASVSVADFYKADSPTAGIQEAVDALPATGGVVFLPAGEYSIIRSINLRSGVCLHGQGEQSRIVRRKSCVEVKLTADALKGAREVKAESVKGLAVGDEVTVFSTESYGWYCTHAIIVAIGGNSLKLDRELTHDYLLKEQAGVNNFHPAIYALEASDIRVEDLYIDGGMEHGAKFKNEFTVSAVHFNAVTDAIISRLHVKAWPGDGISMQRGDNVTVTECLSEYNLGHGFHPGTGITSGAWTDNTGRFNGWDGLFFCHRVRHSTMRGNRFHDNGWNGIGGLGEGGEGGDRYNVVSDNFCWNNARSGIECIRGGNNIVANNVCQNNSQGEPGRYPGILVEDFVNSVISGNRVLDFQPDSAKTQAWGILVTGSSHDNVIEGNLLTGHPKGGLAGEALGNNTLSNNLSRPEHLPAGL